ncbi:MAG: prenyltransferase [Candidatus Thermoplasmatota archaeon]|jgi:chlorophyll synthase|nr:prenyltransferase [Candidatus Thermoplasmatota archaeon]
MSKATKNNLSLFLNEFIRISDAFKWTAISFVGFILGITQLSIIDYIIPFLIFVSSTLSIMAFTFAINNFYDTESDKKNPRRKESNAIASEIISKKTSVFYLLVLAIISIIISIFLFRIEVFIFCIFLLFLGWAYSAPPIRTKNIPGLDVIWHFIGFFSYIIWGSLIAGASVYCGSISLMTWLIAISIGIFSCIGQVWNHIVDYSFDKDAKVMTFAVKIGLNKAKKTLILLIILHIIFLIPLILLFIIKNLITVILLIFCLIIGYILLKPKKTGFPSRQSFEFYFATIFGGSVYFSCLIYHLFFLLGM